MKKLIIIVIVGLGFTISCNKPSLESNAEVISFNSEKCMCCWGWTLKMDDKIIHTKSAVVGEEVGYKINKPVSVYIELGEEDGCLDYYEINKIEKAK